MVMGRRVVAPMAVVAATWLLNLTLVGVVAAQPLPDQVGNLLRSRLGQGEQPGPERTVAGNTLQATTLLAQFYSQRHYLPVWSDTDGVQPVADGLMRALRRASLEGLEPRYYHLDTLDALWDELLPQHGAQALLTPERLAEEIRSHLPGFEIDYDVDPIRQAIADSWPDSLDDRVARAEWGWAPQYDLKAMTEHMLDKLERRLRRAE